MSQRHKDWRGWELESPARQSLVNLLDHQSRSHPANNDWRYKLMRLIGAFSALSGGITETANGN